MMTRPIRLRALFCALALATAGLLGACGSDTTTTRETTTTTSPTSSSTTTTTTHTTD